MFFNLAGFHQLILEQKLVALKQELLLVPVLKKMTMDSYIYQQVTLEDDNEQKIQMFIEWLKWQPTEIYKLFMKALRKTDQAALAEKLLNASRYKYPGLQKKSYQKKIKFRLKL